MTAIGSAVVNLERQQLGSEAAVLTGLLSADGKAPHSRSFSTAAGIPESGRSFRRRPEVSNWWISV